MCIRDAWVATIERVKEQCLVVAASLIEELAQRFPNQEFMNGIARLYGPQYWLNSKTENMFPTHLALLKAQYYFETEANVEGLKVPNPTQ